MNEKDDTVTKDTEDGYNDDSNTLEDRYERRRQLLADGCRKFSDRVKTPTGAWYEMYYDDKMDYVYCLVSKVSCTSWKRTLIMLGGKVTKFQRPEQMSMVEAHSPDFTRKWGVRILADVHPEYRHWRFRDDRYFTFLFVREPLERLVSAYRDKVAEHHSRTDIKIVQKYRPSDYHPSMKRYNVSFAEFVRYVLDEHAAGRVLNRHWLPQSQLCRVCQYRWNFVGHHETLHQDADYVVSELKSRIVDAEQRHRVEAITFPVQSGHRLKSDEFVQQMFATVPATDVEALFRLYEMDYLLFGFKHPKIAGFT